MAYNYTDLTVIMTIDPKWLADGGTVYAGLEGLGGNAVEVETTTYNTETGAIVADFTQAQTSQIQGVAYVQCNGFLNGKRWASEKKKIFVGTNTIRRIINAN